MVAAESKGCGRLATRADAHIHHFKRNAQHIRCLDKNPFLLRFKGVYSSSKVIRCVIGFGSKRINRSLYSYYLVIMV